MALALEEARQAAALGEVPVGAVVIGPSGRILARTGNRVETQRDPTAHAEILAIRKACAAVGDPRLPDAILYVTLEPCAMCAQAIAHARLKRLVFGAWDPKGGGVDHGARVFDLATTHHRPEVVGGVAARECAALLEAFFRGLR